MALVFDSYFDKVPSFLYLWKYVPAQEECNSRWSKWSPVFTTSAGKPFQARVNLDSHLVEFSVEGVTITSSPLEQVSKYVEEVLNDNPVS
jgi:hypothetical protein